MPGTPTAPSSAPPRRRHRWLLLIPFVWQAGLAPLVNDIAFRPFGLPFAMCWQIAGIMLASVVIAIVFGLDTASGVDAEEADFLARSLEAEEKEGAP